jgi:hypothetical protein
MKSEVSISMVDELAGRVGIAIKRFGPSWGWFTTDAEGKKRKFASSNLEAYKQLEVLWEAMQEAITTKVKVKEKKFWSCIDVLGLTFPATKARRSTVYPALAVCAVSRYAVVKMLDAHYGCGKGTPFPSFEYRVKKYWAEGWPLHMLPLKSQVSEVGIWEVSSLKKVA